MLGLRHAESVAELGAVPVLFDRDAVRLAQAVRKLKETHNVHAHSHVLDITDPAAVQSAFESVQRECGSIDILINNAANNPIPTSDQTPGKHWSRLENFSLEAWDADLQVGLTGAFLCSREAGKCMVRQKKGVILNIASDLGLIAPDQRIYRKPGLADHEQPVKPVTYSVVKAGVLGLTRYLATYWAESGIRVNALIPGGVDNHLPADFVKNVTSLIPMGRMARPDEYKSAVAFLVSDASAYMTGSSLTIDGGRTCW